VSLEAGLARQIETFPTRPYACIFPTCDRARRCQRLARSGLRVDPLGEEALGLRRGPSQPLVNLGRVWGRIATGPSGAANLILPESVTALRGAPQRDPDRTLARPARARRTATTLVTTRDVGRTPTRTRRPPKPRPALVAVDMEYSR